MGTCLGCITQSKYTIEGIYRQDYTIVNIWIKPGGIEVKCPLIDTVF